MKLKHEVCGECTSTSTQLLCKEIECHHLCYHMYHCDTQCYDYSNGHICKHIHRVHSMRLSLNAADTSHSELFTELSSETEPDNDPLEFAESVRKATG